MPGKKGRNHRLPVMSVSCTKHGSKIVSVGKYAACIEKVRQENLRLEKDRQQSRHTGGI